MMPRWTARFCLSLLIGLSAWASILVYQFYQPIGVDFAEKRYVVIKKNTSLNQLCQQLYKDGYVSHPKLLSIWLRLLDRDTIQAGVYQVNGHNSVIHLLDDLNQGHVVQLPFMIIEGQTWSSVKSQLLIKPWLKYDIIDNSIVKNYNHGTLDGLLLAETYYYNAGSAASEVVKRANEHLNKTLSEAWQSRDEKLPYKSSYELLIAASIIEKETAIESERPLISQVIANRLKKRMRLQMDPTVIYALGNKYHGSLSKKSLKVDSPYNTYRYYGLPPTPIAMVSKDAIDSAAHPKSGDYLYFVATGDGRHFFSSNYQQHRQAVQRYIKGEV